MQAVTLGKKSGWKTVTQQVGGIVPNTDYTFGAWIKGSGAVTIKTATNSGENLQFIRPKATNTWTYVSASFNSGTFSGTVVFTISDSAGSALPEAEAAGTMYVDDVFFGMTGETNLLLNGGFEEQLKFWGGDKGTVFTRYPNRSDNPPAQQYEGIDNLGVYVWDRNPEGVTDFGDWIGRSPYLAEDFLEQNTWSDLEGGVRLAPWKDSPYAGKMLWAAYPFPKSGGSLAEAASGAYNDHYRALGENLIANGMAKATIRFGHEFNGGWYIWSIGNANDPNHLQKAQDFAEAFRQFVTTLRSIEGQAFKFVWNPSTSVWGVDLEAAFPGRDYADFVGIDHYDQSWAQNNGTSIYGSAYQNADPAERLRRQQIAWNAEVNDGNWGLNMIAQFAEDQGVPLAICEWGLAARADGMGGADNPYFIEKMHEWIENNNVAWHVYFNVSADDGDHDLYDTVAFPLASAKFSELWDPNGAPDTSPAIEPADIPGIGAQYVKVEGEDGILTGSANRYHGDPWASGGEFAVMYKSVNALTFTNVNKADGGLAIVYQGWESDQKASLYVNGVLVKPNIPFPQHGRSWSNSYGYVVLNDVQIPAGATVKLQINPSDELNNYGSLKIDYLLLLGATGAYVPGDASDITDVNDSVSVPSRTSYSHSGTWALAANVKGTGDTNGSSYNTKPTLTAGKSYTFGAWIKGSGKMALVIQNTSNWAEVLVKPFQATGQWQYVAATYTPAATGAYNIKLGDRDTSGSMGRIYIDDVKLAGTEDGVAVIDDNFEDGGVKWWHPANYFVMTDFSQNTGGSDAHSGKWAMKVASSAAAQDQETTLDAQLKLKAGVAYTFKLWLKGTGDLKVRLQNGQNGQLIADEPFSAAGEWREYAFTVTPAESSSYSLKLFSDGTNNALYVDDLLLYASGQNNLLPNSDFELGQAGWLENGTFSVTDASEVAFDQGLLDGLDNLSKAKETGNLTIDGTNAGWYGEDPARAVRQTDGEGYLVYELPAGIRSISVAMYEPAGADGASVTASVSDGNGFEALALTKDRYPNAAKADMPLTVYGSYDIPEGKTLIRVTLPDRSGGQLSEVALNVTAAPVTANPGAGEITAGQSVTLATAEADGTIYYRFASSPDKMRYIGPIAMAHSGSIAAWTEKDGKRKSIVRTFSYVNADEVLVDAYGQIRGAEFTGKVHGESEFEQAAIADESFREGLSAPSDRDEYGGLSGEPGRLPVVEDRLFSHGKAERQIGHGRSARQSVL
ncbi:carbohydrate binding domain-containing protein [Cohnella rhizosphaerae]|uniref:Carbohydrate binding domain-containing protein n=1 Tax=Cohnella rhizosphaerae TaxID=1457232 RepID=A0A9X4QRY1_9BACL|nr:carbohydrate binding domain-containing protein [Cohnella rhizosphaerae]MDG0808753.1 carbohydrate binding domain-containing protein [Cohnella rhizosphaerae]